MAVHSSITWQSGHLVRHVLSYSLAVLNVHPVRTPTFPVTTGFYVLKGHDSERTALN